MKKNLLMLAVLCLIMSLSLEAAWRVFHPFGAKISFSTPDPQTAWRFKAGQKYWFFKENDHAVEGRINKFGWKDREWSLEKPAGTCRIAVLGDSYVEALQLENDRNFLALTEKKLEGRLPCRPELMNFGRSGTTQSEELLFLKSDVLRFKPDLVVLVFYPPNDVRDVLPETAWLDRPFFKPNSKGGLDLDTSYRETRQYKLRAMIDPIKRHSAFISWLAERLTSLMLQQSKDRTNAGGTEEKLGGYLSLASSDPDPVYVRAYQLNKRLIKEIAGICKKERIRFLLVAADTPAYVPGIEQAYKQKSPSFNPAFFEDDLGAFARESGIEFLGMERDFRASFESDKKPLHWGFEMEKTTPRLGFEEHGGHWNYEGHVKVSQILAEKAEQMLSAPAESPSA